jgi:hypothetical protein
MDRSICKFLSGILYEQRSFATKRAANGCTNTVRGIVDSHSRQRHRPQRKSEFHHTLKVSQSWISIWCGTGTPFPRRKIPSGRSLPRAVQAWNELLS